MPVIKDLVTNLKIYTNN